MHWTGTWVSPSGSPSLPGRPETRGPHWHAFSTLHLDEPSPVEAANTSDKSGGVGSDALGVYT